MTVELGAVVDIKDVVNAAGLIGPVDDAIGSTRALGTSPIRRDSQAVRHSKLPSQPGASDSGHHIRSAKEPGKERPPDQLRLREVEIRCCRSLDRKSLRFSAGGSYGIRDRYGR